MEKQKMRFSESELSLLKNSFAENEYILKSIRKVFLQIPLDENETNVVHKSLVGQEALFALVSKVFLPTIEPDAPFHQVIDLWMTVDIKDKTPKEAYSQLVARETLIKYLTQQLSVLGEVGTDSKSKVSITFESLSFSDKKTEEEAYSDLIARNTLIAHVEQQLTQINLLAGIKEETVAQTKARLAKDSAK